MASYIGRRKFLATLGGAAAAWPLAARAQQPGKLPTIGFLGAGTPSTQGQWSAAFVQRLRELGWIEGRNVAIEYRWAEGRPNASPRSRPSSSGLRSMSCHIGKLQQSWRPSRRHRSSRLSSRRRGTRSAPAWSRAWRDRAATSPACRSADRYLPASGLSFCARLSPASAGWRSWPMSTIPLPCWRCVRSRQRPAPSASRSSRLKSGEPRTSHPPSRRSKAAQTHFMSLPTRS